MMNLHCMSAAEPLQCGVQPGHPMFGQFHAEQLGAAAFLVGTADIPTKAVSQVIFMKHISRAGMHATQKAPSDGRRMHPTLTWHFPHRFSAYNSDS